MLGIKKILVNENKVRHLETNVEKHGILLQNDNDEMC